MGNGGNPTALRTAGGSRFAGRNTLNAFNRLRNRNGGLNTLFGRARSNNRRRPRATNR